MWIDPAEADVEALILVSGQGTRLRPLTLGTPEPMLPAVVGDCALRFWADA
jgi:CTP:phosphocholine cytidylyltransferase-like protein